jgi:hypothetical protein
MTWMSLLIVVYGFLHCFVPFRKLQDFSKREINEDGVYSQYIWAEYQNRRS